MQWKCLDNWEAKITGPDKNGLPQVTKLNIYWEDNEEETDSGLCGSKLGAGKKFKFRFKPFESILLEKQWGF